MMSMEDFVKRVDNSWIRDLNENEDNEEYFPNRESRQGKGLKQSTKRGT